jgi:RNA polymerase sigma-B factor
MPEVRPIREPLPVLARSREPEWLLRRYAAERDPALLEELVTRFRPLVTKLALRYVRTSESLEDLEQVGAMGLVKAIERFDPDRGYAFSSFAVPTILGEIKRSIRATAWSAHVPRRMQERVADLRRALEAASARSGSAPTVAELGERLGWEAETVLEAMTAARALSTTSLDGPVGLDGEEAATLADRLGEEDAAYGTVEDRCALERALPALTPAQREVLELRFDQELKQSDIAARLGCSQMQVSRLLRAALERLSTVAGHQSQTPR